MANKLFIALKYEENVLYEYTQPLKIPCVCKKSRLLDKRLKEI